MIDVVFDRIKQKVVLYTGLMEISRVIFEEERLFLLMLFLSGFDFKTLLSLSSDNTVVIKNLIIRNEKDYIQIGLASEYFNDILLRFLLRNKYVFENLRKHNLNNLKKYLNSLLFNVDCDWLKENFEQTVVHSEKLDKEIKIIINNKKLKNINLNNFFNIKSLILVNRLS